MSLGVVLRFFGNKIFQVFRILANSRHYIFSIQKLLKSKLLKIIKFGMFYIYEK